MSEESICRVSHAAPTRALGERPARALSFEEWQEEVGALDRAISRHLGPQARDNWRLIEVPRMLADWKAQRCTSSYLGLTERFMRVLAPFTLAGSLSPSVSDAHLRDCELFLKAQNPRHPREETLLLLARKQRKLVAKAKKQTCELRAA